MTKMSSFKKLTLAALAVASLSAAVATSAEARPWRGGGYFAGGLATGLILGAATSSAYAYGGPTYVASDCVPVRRWVETPYGLVRRTVCARY